MLATAMRESGCDVAAVAPLTNSFNACRSEPCSRFACKAGSYKDNDTNSILYGNPFQCRPQISALWPEEREHVFERALASSLLPPAKAQKFGEKRR